MSPHAKLIADLYETRKPDLWRKCYPRTYTGIGEYESPRYVAVILASSIEWICGSASNNAPLTARHITLAAAKAFQNNLPAFFVTRDFLVAATQTDLPDDIRWTDAKLPYEAGLIYLPINALRDPQGDSVSVLGWCRTNQGDEIMIEQKIRVPCVDDTFTVFAICDSNTERLYSSTVRANEMPFIKWKTSDTKPVSAFDLPLTDDDKDFLHQTVCVTFSLLLAQTAKPALTTKGKCEGVHKKSNREMWTPNFLGKGYLARREKSAGTHSSPRLHWRRGRYTHQPIGDFKSSPDFISVTTLPRLEDGRIDWQKVDDETSTKFWRNHKHIWIEPVLLEG